MDRKTLRPGIKGKRNVERVNYKSVNETFISEYPLKNHEIDIIELLDIHRAMHTSDIIKILNCRYSRSPNRIRESLRDLHIARFIERKTKITEKIGKGSHEPYYLLDKAGAMYLAFQRNVDLEQIKWQKRDNGVNPDNLAHTFGLSKIRTAVEEIVKKTGTELVDYKSDRQVNIFFKMGPEREEIQFLPDSYFYIRQNSNAFNNFIEFDRDTEDLNTIARKAAVYEAFYLSKEYIKHFGEQFPNVLFIVQEKENRKQKDKRVNEMIRSVLQVKQRVSFGFCSFDDFLENPLNQKIYTII